MRTIPAAKFKAQCLALLDRVSPEGVVITKHGKPVAKLIPIGTESAALIGSLRGKLRIKGGELPTPGSPTALVNIKGKFPCA